MKARNRLAGRPVRITRTRKTQQTKSRDLAMTSNFSIYLKGPRRHTDMEIKCCGNVATSIHSQIVCDVFRTKLRDSQKQNGLQSQKLSPMALRKEGLIPVQLIRNKGLPHPPTILRTDPRTSCTLGTIYSASDPRTSCTLGTVYAASFLLCAMGSVSLPTKP